MMLYKMARQVVLSLCMLCVWGTSVLIQAEPILQDIDLPVYISQAQGNPSVVVGMDAQASQLENKAYQYLSVDIKDGIELKEALLPLAPPAIKGGIVHIYSDGAEVKENYWKELAEAVLALEKDIWLNVMKVEDSATEEVAEVIKSIEEAIEEVPKHKIQFIHTPETIEEVHTMVGDNKRLLHIEVQEQSDLQLLEMIYKVYQKQVQVILTDAISQSSVTTELDKLTLINKLYYELPIRYPNVVAIYQGQSQGNSAMSIKNTYNRVLSQSWLSLEAYGERGIAAIPVDYVTPITDKAMQVYVTLEKQNIEYIEYKLNGKFLGRVTRYPYAMKINGEDIYKDNNELRVIVKYKDQPEMDVEVSYLQSNVVPVLQERNARTTPTYPVGREMVYKTKYIPVLMYHMFKDVVRADEADQSMSVSIQLFEQHIQRLNKEGYTPITFMDYENYLNGTGGLPDKPYIITADDGYLDNYTHAFPILKKYKVPATFFITTQYVGMLTNFDHFTWEQAQEMEASGLVDIQSHSNAHVLLDTVDKEEVNYEVNRSFGEIEQRLGKRDVKVLAYPQFQHTAMTQEWISSYGIKFQMTNLIKKGDKSQRADVKRIHVHNQMSTDDLVKEIKRVTE